MMTDEDRQMLLKELKKQDIQPLPFSKLSAPFKSGIDEEKWTGIRGIYDWQANSLYKMEFTGIIDNARRLNNVKVNTMAVLPLQTGRGDKAIFLMGRKDFADFSQGLQAHVNLSDRSKLSLVASHPKPDISQGHYVAEYSYEFDRLITSLKFSNMDSSFSAVATVMKNVFVGFEAVKHVKFILISQQL